MVGAGLQSSSARAAARSPTQAATAPAHLGLWLYQAAQVWVQYRRRCLRERGLIVSFYVFLCPFAEEKHLRFGSGLRLCGSQKAYKLQSREPHTRLSTQHWPFLLLHCSGFVPKDWISAVQPQTWKKNGVTNIGQLPMHHGTGNLAEQPFSFSFARLPMWFALWSLNFFKKGCILTHAVVLQCSYWSPRICLSWEADWRLSSCMVLCNKQHL